MENQFKYKVVLADNVIDYKVYESLDIIQKSTKFYLHRRIVQFETKDEALAFIRFFDKPMVINSNYKYFVLVSDDKSDIRLLEFLDEAKKAARYLVNPVIYFFKNLDEAKAYLNKDYKPSKTRKFIKKNTKTSNINKAVTKQVNQLILEKNHASMGVSFIETILTNMNLDNVNRPNKQLGLNNAKLEFCVPISVKSSKYILDFVIYENDKMILAICFDNIESNKDIKDQDELIDKIYNDKQKEIYCKENKIEFVRFNLKNYELAEKIIRKVIIKIAKNK